jgi:predicted secreted protein
MCQTNLSITFSDAMIDATCKQSLGYSISLPGLREFAFTDDALVNFDEGASDLGITTLMNAYKFRTPINILIKNPIIDAGYYLGLTYVQSIEINAPMEDVVSYTVEFTGTYIIVR